MTNIEDIKSSQDLSRDIALVLEHKKYELKPFETSLDQNVIKRDNTNCLIRMRAYLW